VNRGLYAVAAQGIQLISFQSHRQTICPAADIIRQIARRLTLIFSFFRELNCKGNRQLTAVCLPPNYGSQILESLNLSVEIIAGQFSGSCKNGGQRAIKACADGAQKLALYRGQFAIVGNCFSNCCDEALAPSSVYSRQSV